MTRDVCESLRSICTYKNRYVLWVVDVDNVDNVDVDGVFVTVNINVDQ